MIRVAAQVALTKDLVPEVEAIARVVNVATGREVLQRTLRVRRQWQKVTLGRLVPGSYRFEIEGRGDTASLSDVFVVAAPDEMTDP